MTDQPFIIIIAWSGEKKSIQALHIIAISSICSLLQCSMLLNALKHPFQLFLKNLSQDEDMSRIENEALSPLGQDQLSNSIILFISKENKTKEKLRFLALFFALINDLFQLS